MCPARKALFFFYLRVYNRNVQWFTPIIAGDHNGHSNPTIRGFQKTSPWTLPKTSRTHRRACTSDMCNYPPSIKFVCGEPVLYDIAKRKLENVSRIRPKRTKKKQIFIKQLFCLFLPPFYYTTLGKNYKRRTHYTIWQSVNFSTKYLFDTIMLVSVDNRIKNRCPYTKTS